MFAGTNRIGWRAMHEPTGIRIPPEALAAETLRNLLEEFVTRDGTELTDLEVKVRQVEQALKSGDLEIWFSPELKTCSLRPA